MGIYSCGNIFGISIFVLNDNGSTDILFRKNYTEIMTDKQKKEAYLFYTCLNNKNNILFNMYVECVTTYKTDNTETFITWMPISLEEFLEKFDV